MKRWTLSLLLTGALLLLLGCQTSGRPAPSADSRGEAAQRTRDIQVLAPQMSNSSRRPFIAINATPGDASEPYMGIQSERSLPPVPPATAGPPPPVRQQTPPARAPQAPPPAEPEPAPTVAQADLPAGEPPPPPPAPPSPPDRPEVLPEMPREFTAEPPRRLEMPVPILSRWVDWDAIPGGWVRLEISLDEVGNVTRARVLESSHPDLEDPALDAIRQARYSPLLDPFGRPVIVTIEDRIEF